MTFGAPIQFVSHRRGSSSPIRFEIDQKAIARIERKLQRASGKNLYITLQRANLSRGDELAKKIKSAAPRHTGNLRDSVKARAERSWGKATTTVLVGPMAPHRHLVIYGTKSRPSDRDGTGRTRTGKTFVGTESLGWRAKVGTYSTGRMRSNPFVDRAAAGFSAKIRDYVHNEWRRLLY